MGDDIFHRSASELIVDKAPNAQLIESWKEGEARETAILKCEQFLDDHN